eukprot:CAMPEP_0114973332 /NCGR_PEP_ID=MMETSP0216-20121206/897_1 /TAXON_ID=223996 /ORGANISM="Protocruzia adherens, Strain Boccale" /LENGTH=219 /DNA_ID=CAMNT_0002333815 /DNA_START=827 /DNA_END=1486 /DNA_ORIENTATION=-
MIFFSIVVLFVQMFLFYRVVTENVRHTFNGNDEMATARILGCLFAMILQLAGGVNSIIQGISVSYLQDSVFTSRSESTRHAAKKRFLCSMLFIVQATLDAFIAVAIITSLFRIEDDEKAVGFVSDLTSLLILAELDNIGYTAVVYLGGVFDRSLNEGTIEELKEEICAHSEIPYNVEVDLFSKQIPPLFFIYGWLATGIILVFYSDRFINQSYSPMKED